MRFFKPLDYWKWAEREDIVTDDVYQDPLDPEAGMRAAMAGDLMRSLGHGKPWLLMEQSPEPRQLARRERAEGARADAVVEPAGAGARRRRSHVLPVAPVAGRGREVPQRDGPARPNRIVADMA